MEKQASQVNLKALSQKSEIPKVPVGAKKQQADAFRLLFFFNCLFGVF